VSFATDFFLSGNPHVACVGKLMVKMPKLILNLQTSYAQPKWLTEPKVMCHYHN